MVDQGDDPAVRELPLKLLIAAAWLAVVAACAPHPAPGVRVVTIRIEHSRFRPSHLDLEAGTTVRFVLRNADPIDHEFIVGDERVQEVHERGTERHHGAKPGEVTVPGLQQRTTSYTFEQAGSMIFGCHLPGHYAYGMRGDIVVR